MAVNELTDLTPAEFKKMLGFKTDVKGSLLDADAETEVAGDTSNLAEAQLNLEDLPQSVDWSKHFGSKWRIRSQGQCGSCWSFSAASMIESTHAIANKLTTPLDVSEQELLDCTSRTSSCNGGYFVDAARYVKANGISLESKYKYAVRFLNKSFQVAPFWSISNDCASRSIISRLCVLKQRFRRLC